MLGLLLLGIASVSGSDAENSAEVLQQVRSLILAEKASLYKPLSVSTLLHDVPVCSTKPESQLVELQLEDDTPLLVCDQPTANGFFGAVFEALLLCPDEETVKQYNCDSKHPLPRGVSALGSRKVAVKFGREDAGDPQREIGNLKKLSPHADLFVKYVGTVRQPLPQGRFHAEFSGQDQQGVAQALVSPGLVMEWIQGKRVADTNFPTPENSAQAEYFSRTACLDAQYLMAFEEELAAGVFDTDVTDANTMFPTESATEFQLSEKIKCPRIRLIDVGFVMPINEAETAVFALLSRLLITPLTNFIAIYKLANIEDFSSRKEAALALFNLYPKEFIDLLARVLQPARTQVENLFAILKETLQRPAGTAPKLNFGIPESFNDIFDVVADAQLRAFRERWSSAAVDTNERPGPKISMTVAIAIFAFIALFIGGIFLMS